MSAYNKFDTQTFLEGEGEDAVAQITGFEPAATEPLGKQKLAPQTFAAFATFARRGRRISKAERRAFEAAVINWMNSNAPVNGSMRGILNGPTVLVFGGRPKGLVMGAPNWKFCPVGEMLNTSARLKPDCSKMSGVPNCLNSPVVGSR